MDILLVDDDRVDREFLIRSIRQNDLSSNIVEVSSACDSMLIFKQHFFDVVFLDYRLSDDCGFNVLEQMRKVRPERTSAIIMMSGAENESVSVQAIKAGAQDFIIKSEINAAGVKRCIIHSRARVQFEDEIYAARMPVQNVVSAASTH